MALPARKTGKSTFTLDMDGWGLYYRPLLEKCSYLRGDRPI